MTIQRKNLLIISGVTLTLLSTVLWFYKTQTAVGQSCETPRVKGQMCGYYFNYQTRWNCEGVDPGVTCPPNYQRRCWNHGGKYANDPVCSCFRDVL